MLRPSGQLRCGPGAKKPGGERELFVRQSFWWMLVLSAKWELEVFVVAEVEGQDGFVAYPGTIFVFERTGQYGMG